MPRSAADASTPEREPKGSAGGPGVLEKALFVLELFTERRAEWTVTEVSRELTLPFTTAQRIIRALEKHALLERTERRGYRLGSGAIDLGRRARASVDLRALLAPALHQLWRETDETTSLTIVETRRRIGARCIDRVEGGYPFRLSPDVDTVTPLHAGASGKALLAHLDDEVLDHLTSTPLESCAVNTLVDVESLRTDLRQIRSRGWAFDDQELIDGAWGMAASVLDDSGQLVASIGFISPTIRLTAELKRRGVGLVLEAAEAASAALRARTTPTA